MTGNRRLPVPLVGLFLLLFVWGVPSFLFAKGADEGTESGLSAGYLGPCDLLLDRSETFLYVLESDSSDLRRLRTDGSGSAEVLPLPIRPTRMTFFPDESAIAIAGTATDRTDPLNPDGTPRTGEPWETEGTDRGMVVVVRVGRVGGDSTGDGATSMEIVGRFEVGQGPSDVAVAPMRGDGETSIFVSNQFSGTVTEIAWPTGAMAREFDVGREPSAMKITPDGKFLVIANMLPEHRADASRTMSSVRIVEVESGEVHRVELLNGITNLKDIALSPDGNYAFVTGTIGNYITVPIQVVGGWIVENIFTIIDIPNHEMVETVYLDDTIRGTANPWGIDVAEDGSFLVFTASGTNEVVFMPFNQVMEIVTLRPSPRRPGLGSYTYFSRPEGEVRLPIRMRVTLGVPGMRRVLIRGNRVWVAALFEDAIGRLTITLDPPYEFYPEKGPLYPAAPLPVRPEEDVVTSADPPLHFIELEPFSPLKGVTIKREIARLGPKPVLTSERKGMILFHSALPCMEHWQSCVTCHPDARVDALNWDLLNDGIGNPKSSKSLLLSHETPPSMITGVRKDAETAVRAGVVHILFSQLPEEDYQAMDDYLRALRPVPSPRLVDGRLSESAKRGKILFESDRTGCSSCHPAPLFTDLSLHRTGSHSYNDTHTRFDTPTLIEVWRTAPYMNNGHYLTIRDVLLDAKHGNKDGKLDQLTDQELDDLIEYVLSL